MQTRQNHFLQAAAHSKSVLNSIRSTIIDLIQKLDDIESEPSAEGLILKAPNVVLLEVSSLIWLDEFGAIQGE